MRHEPAANPAWSTILPSILAFVVTAMGVSNVIGWMTGERTLLEPFAAFDHMQPIGAICVVAAGLGLFSLARGWTIIALAAALVSGLLGATELASHVGGSGAALEWLTVPYVAHGLRLEPRQIPPNVALAFALGSVAVGVIQRYPFGAAALAATTATLGLVALMGYGTGVPGAFAWGDRTPMSLVQSTAILLYGVGIVLCAFRSDSSGDRVWVRCRRCA
jgi:hypothetical protein